MWPFTLWLESGLEGVAPFDCIEEELAAVSKALTISPPLHAVKRTIRPMHPPLKSEDEIDWDALIKLLRADQATGHIIVLNCPEDQYLADGNWDAIRIGLNLHCMLRHVAGDELTRVLKAVVRHELGHVLLPHTQPGPWRARFRDDVLDSLENLDAAAWRDTAIEERFDRRLKELEGASEGRLVWSFGWHCLRNNCIMRQRASRQSRLAFLEIAECGYCEICGSCVRASLFTG